MHRPLSPDPHDLTRMAQNLQLLRRQFTEPQQPQEQELHQQEYHPHHAELSSYQFQHHPSRQSSPAHSKSSPQHSRRNQTTAVALRFIYQEYLQAYPLPQPHEQKITTLLDQPASPGNAIALFEMLHYFKEALANQLLEEIADKTMTALAQAKSSEDRRCYAELLAICGQENEQLCQLMAESLLQAPEDFDQAFLVLTNQGPTGLAYLLDLATRDLPLSSKILDHLARCQPVIRALLLPALVNAASDPTPARHRDLALAALNRIAPLLPPSALSVLAGLLHDPATDKKLLLATIRCAGLAGEQTVLSIANSKTWGDPITSLALSVLSWRVPTRPVLRVRAIEYTLQHSFLPGRLYQYEGSLEPWDYSQEHCPDTLCLSARDFLAHLELALREHPHSLTHSNSLASPALSQLLPALQLDDDQPLQVSGEAVQALTLALKHKSSSVREVALLQLGNIGHPHASGSADQVAKCLSDPDCTIRSAACWTIARLSPVPSKKLELTLGHLLRDTFWKVRTSACLALGLLRPHSPLPATLQALLRCLHDGSLPKPTLCETLARLGADHLLLELLRGSSRNDFKLREAVISSLEFTAPDSPLLTPITEELLKHSRDPRIQTRHLCLLTLNALRLHTQDAQTISYLTQKHLLPLYYCFLDDPAPKIRTLAAQNILSFGPQAELIFIEGITKAQPLAKIQCLKALGKLGPQNFRAVALGLRDEDERVRRAARDTMLACYSPEEVVREFGQRQNHSISLICSLKEILSGPVRHPELRELVQSILEGLQGTGKAGMIRRMDENVSPN